MTFSRPNHDFLNPPFTPHGGTAARSSDARRLAKGTLAGMLAVVCVLVFAGTSQAQNFVTTVAPNDPTKPVVGIAVNPTEDYVYVTQGDGNITIINAATNQVVSSSAPNTNGAGAIATYLNGTFVVNGISNNISSYFAVDPSGPNSLPFQQIYADPNATQPSGVAVSPSGYGKIFVSNAGSNNVSIFTNTATGYTTATVAVGTNPQAIAFNQVTQMLYVADLGDAKVWVIDGGNNTVVTTLNVGSMPRSIAINEVTNQIFVACFGSNTLNQIDGNTNTVFTASNFGTGGPGALAVNPLTNQVFIANLGLPGATGSVTVFNVAANSLTSADIVSGGNGSQAAIVVDPQTDVAYVSIGGSDVMAVNGQTLAVTDTQIGAGGSSALTLDPVTHKVFTAATDPTTGLTTIGIIDGATNVSNTVTPQTGPWSIAVNPATNQIYAANYFSNSVTVIDGATNHIAATVPTGSGPRALAIDPSQNLIYAANFDDDSVTIINGTNNQTTTLNIALPAHPDSLTVNPVLGRVYGAASQESVTFNFQSNFNPNSSQAGASSTGPIASATNPATGMAYTLYANGSIEIDDGAAPHASVDQICSATASTPSSFAVNTQTNTLYITCNGGEVDALQGASGFYGGNTTTIQDPSATLPTAVAIYAPGNKIFVANNGDASGSLTIIDGATNNFSNLPITGNPVAIAVNDATGKVYVQTQVGQSSSIVVIDGISGKILTTINAANTGNGKTQIAADPVNGTIYAANRNANSITDIQENVPSSALSGSALNAPAQPFQNNTTNTTSPTFTFIVSNNLDQAGTYAVYYQVDSQTGVWDYAGYVSTNTYSGTPAHALAPGYHVVYSFAVNGAETGDYSSVGSSSGNEYNPQVGAISSYGFLVAPPIAGVPYYPTDFGTSPVGVATASQQPILINDGGAPLNFTYSISGPNASDFQEVPATNGMTTCNSLGGVLFAGSNCAVNVEFQPSGTGTRTATITFVDNSLGTAGSMQTVALTGVGQAGGAIPLTVNFAGNGIGSVSDSANFTCNTPRPCTQSYPTGNQVTLTATPTAGSIFYGWTGACSGSGTCTVTMNAAQSVTAQFTTSVASSCAPGDSVWVGGASGNWSAASNWSTDQVPNNGVHVCINNSRSPVSSVTLDTNVNIGGLTIDPGNSLTIGNGQQLVVAGTISNAGLITVFSDNANTFLTFSGAVTLTGGGTVTMQQVINNGQPVLNNTNGGSVINVNNLIQGSGQFGNNGLVITNQAAGIINANAVFPLGLNAGGVTNAGLIEATAGATLQLSVSVLNKNGMISASGTNSAMQFSGNADIQGGTLSSTGGGVIGNVVGGSVTLDGTIANQGQVTLAGTYTVGNNGQTTVVGTINNTGTLLVFSNNANTFLTFSGAVTLTGGGTVTMSQGLSNGQPILNNTNSGSVTNVNNLIQGAGQFGNNGLTITNKVGGVINANASLPLGLNGATTNLGLIEATAGGSLQISAAVVNANATVLSTGTNSAVQLYSGTTLRGGTVKTAAGGTLGGVATVTLDGATQGAVTIVGTYTVGNNTTTELSGTINNTGLIAVLSNNANTFLVFSASVTLTGGGTVTMSQAVSNGQPVLNNTNGGALINVNNVIQGSGQIGNNGLLITNQAGGVIDANGGYPLGFTGGTVTNLGLIEATAGGLLQVSVQIINKGATILATGAGSAVQLTSGADILGGTISAATGATCSNNAAVTLDGSTQGALTITGTYTVGNNTSVIVAGTINNNGVILVLSNNANTFLTFSGNVTLTGGGTVTMSQAVSNGQPVLNNTNNGALINVNNVIQGSGQIGNNGLLITNQAGGVIDANGVYPLGFTGGAVTNLGLAEATAGGTLQVSVMVINKGGTLTASGAGSALQLESGADIQGGILSSANGAALGNAATITLDGTAQGVLTIAGTYTVANNTTTILVGTINNTGAIQVFSYNANTFLVFSGNVTLTGNGIVTMSQGVSNGQPILNNTNAGNLTNLNNTIQGSGQLGNNGLVLSNQGIITSNGTYSLSLSGATFTNKGILEVDGSPSPSALTTSNYTQTSAGSLILGVTGADPGAVASQLQNTGVATLAGTLELLFRNGYTPTLGDTFTVLTSGSITGQFSSLQSSTALPNGLVLAATYNPTSVVVSVAQGSTGSTLTITGLGAGTGTVTDTTGVINCTSTAGVTSGVCSAAFQTGTIVTLTATPAAGSTFAAWSACTSTGTCNVAVNGPTSVSATFAQASAGFTLTVSPIGTGNGTVIDNFQQINCTDTAGVISGTCTATYPASTVVNLTSTPAQSSTFGGYSGACTGSGACSVTMNASQTVRASFIPPSQTISLPFTMGTNQTQMATYDCPSNPNPTPANPCLDPNAHAIAFTLPQVNTPFTLTVKVTEVPPDVADGLCPNGDTPTQDFDCRFKSFFTYQTKPNGDTIVPLCYPYANGNCVLYSVYDGTPGTEPNPAFYTGPVSWEVTFNNDTFVPPAPYAGSTPRLYEDPDAFVLPNSPYGTNCSTPMLVGNPGTPTNPAIFCQFVFDITTFYDPNKKVDAGIGGKTKVFSDAVVAIPPATAGFVTVTSTPDAATVTAGNPIGFTIAITNSSAATANNATLNDPLPAATGVNWSISPAYTGPGTCAITGAVGSQVLNCSFGNVATNASFSLHLLSPSSSTGNFINQSYVTATDQQVLSVVNITVQAVNVAFSNLTPSQTITAGISAVSLSGVIGNGNMFPPTGETVGVTINGVTQQAKIVTGGAFNTSFPTASIPVSATPYPITYSYPGDSTFGPSSDSSTALTVNSVAANFTLTVSLIGTGNGSVFDSTQHLSCTDTAGVISGICSASYPAGTVVQLTASPLQPSTFGGWSGACSGTQACSVTMNSAQSVTASFVPPAQIQTLQFTPGTNETQMAAFDCPSNPNPTPANPCLDPNAHAIAFTLPQVNTAFPLTVKVTEVPPDIANGLCPAGDAPTQDFDCRFKTFFTYQTKANGDTVVPLCYPYANGNCVVYSVYSGTPGTEPNPAFYTGPVSWEVTFNNDTFVPPAPYAGSTPRLYEDPDAFVLPNSPYGTNCSTPMLVGNPGTPTNPAIFCQFVFDITTFYDPNKKVDAGIGGKTKVFSDAVVAIPPATAGFVTVTSTPDAAMVTAGSPIGFTISVANGSAATANNATLNDPLPSGTNINWSISPAYSGPGTCVVAGAVGSQVLNCSFGNVAVNASFSLHLLSASSSAGNYINQSYVTATDQQVLSVVNIMVQPPPTPTFGALTPSQIVPPGTSSVTLSGTIGSGTTFPAPGEKVTITIDGMSQQATIGGTAQTAASGTVKAQAIATGNGSFSVVFPIAGIPPSSTPYPITYSYPGDSKLAPATDSSTTLTISSTKKNQTITFGTLPPTAGYGSTFPVTASASSGLPVTITATGACSISSGTVTMTSGTGACTLTATQAGNATYNMATATKTVAATKAGSSTKISANTPNPSNVSQSVTVSFSVTGITKPNGPTGSVKITASTSETCTGNLSAADVGSCALTFTTPGPRTITATYSGDANFAGGTSGSVNQTVASSGASTLLVSPGSIDFGSVPIGFLGVQTVNLKNIGTSPIKFSSIGTSRTGTHPEDFFDLPLCPDTLEPGKSCTVFVSFVPLRNQLGVMSASLTITDNAVGSPQTVPLKGTVINPQPFLTPASLNFGTQKVRSTTASKSVTLTNSGTSPLILAKLASSGDFSIASTTTCTPGLSIAPTRSCRIDVTFSPTSKGPRNGTITIDDNAFPDDQYLRLSGNGN